MRHVVFTLVHLSGNCKPEQARAVLMEGSLPTRSVATARCAAGCHLRVLREDAATQKGTGKRLWPVKVSSDRSRRWPRRCGLLWAARCTVRSDHVAFQEETRAARPLTGRRRRLRGGSRRRGCGTPMTTAGPPLTGGWIYASNGGFPMRTPSTPSAEVHTDPRLPEATAARGPPPKAP